MSEFNVDSTDGDVRVEVNEVIAGCMNFKFATAHEEMNSRKRVTMEDCHRILPVLDESLPRYSFIGIYDGHGGRKIVDFLENELEATIAQEFKQDDDAGIEERLTRAFLITDMKSKKLDITTSGATAVVAIIKNDASDNGARKQLIVGNVGDSRAVLVSTRAPVNDNVEEPTVAGYYAHRLTYDHRADDKAEQKRIADAGGFVSRNRVLGILAVTRSFGDHGMKDFVTAQPYISITNLMEFDNPPILILACDGVWDVFSDQEAADLLMERFQKEGPFEDAAKYLVQAAIERGSTDNVTAVVVFL